jgi:hypothetical protein
MYVCMYVYYYIYILYNVYIYIYLFAFLSIPRAGCLTFCFSSIQGTSFVREPVVGPANRHFRRTFIASVSVCVSRGCLQGILLEWKCWMCESVCTYECIWQLFDLKSSACCTCIANSCCTCIASQYGVYKHQDTRTYMYRQTDRHSGWISEIVAAHTLAHVLNTRTPLRCGWAAVGTCMHACMCMHVWLSLSFSFGENTVVSMLY